MSSKKSSQKAQSELGQLLPGHAKILTEIGDATSQATSRLVALIEGSPALAGKWQNDNFRILAEALKGWGDAESAAIIDSIRERWETGADVDLPALNRWTRFHQKDRDFRAVIDCLSVDPPEGITVTHLLSRAGSQKLVFLANWQIAQREVVLKRFIGLDAAKRLLPRELLPHPLSMAHPNIIETHLLQNNKGERFLVERHLSLVLNDLWRSHGVHEAANLLSDLASALAFLQSKELVHGDIKPDNIGYEDQNYILLDFGICRPPGVFAEDSTPTGSLRTRAPELLLGEKTHNYASDIWALGATVYNAITGRFPLFELGEVPPRLSHLEERRTYEAQLALRAKGEWDRRVDLSIVHEPLQGLLGRSLQRDPNERINATNLLKLCAEELAAFVRGSEGPGGFSPSQELEQLRAYLPGTQILSRMPYSRKHELKELLQHLEGAKGLVPEQKSVIEELKSRLS